MTGAWFHRHNRPPWYRPARRRAWDIAVEERRQEMRRKGELRLLVAGPSLGDAWMISDEQLRAIDGIGEHSIRFIRQAVGEYEPQPPPIFFPQELLNEIRPALRSQAHQQQEQATP